MKKILGLDIGTNSIGWALIENDLKEGKGKILGTGSRIIPMSQDLINDFGRGNSISKTAERTNYRGMRRLRERHLLRRERLVSVFKKMNWLPENFDPQKHKIAYTDNKFNFADRHNQLLKEFQKRHPELKNIPQDWTIYYLRKIGLAEKLSPQELTWIIIQFNQKRGYNELRGDESADENIPDNKEFVEAEIKEIVDTGEKNKNLKILEIHLDNGLSGTINLKETPDWKGTRKELILTTRELKSGELKRTFTFPDENDWTLRKKKTEHVISSQNKHVGTYIMDTLLENPNAKIRGKEVHTIDRDYYKNELVDIL